MKPRVLITREAERADALIRALDRQGITGICVPVTHSEPIPNPEELPDFAPFSWIIFTSVHGVEAFSAWLKREKRQLPSSTRLAAVGQATADAARKQLREPEVIPEQATGGQLAKEIIQVHRANDSPAVLWPCARKRMHELEESLAQAGMRVKAWECYQTTPVEPGALRSQLESVAPWDTILLAAPSAVRAFMAAWPLPWNFSILAVGHSTATALRELGATDLTVCRQASPEGMLEAVLSALHRDRNVVGTHPSE